MACAAVGGAAFGDFDPGEGGEGEDPDFIVEGLVEVDAVEAAVVVDVVGCAVGGGCYDGAALGPGCVWGGVGGGLLEPGFAGDVVDGDGAEEGGAVGLLGGVRWGNIEMEVKKNSRYSPSWWDRACS